MLWLDVGFIDVDFLTLKINGIEKYVHYAEL